MSSKVKETFRDGTILITGSTGFLGQLLMEKLLWSCPLKNIAVLVRGKNELTAHQRFKDIYETPLFDRLRKEKPDFVSYIKIIEGHIEDKSLYLSSRDRDWLMENVNFVFHCAAAVKFNLPLHEATKINVRGTEYVLELAKEMKNLKGFVYVSTAYSHFIRDEIKEQFYPIPITADDLKNINESIMNVAAKWPNTYTFTKAITENMIETNENNLPISIFRPSVFGCTKSEPCPGWVKSMNGPPGFFIPIIIGFWRVLNVDLLKKWDLIPADYIVNALICVMWDTVNMHQDKKEIINPKKKPKIFNFVGGVESPMIGDVLFKTIIYDCYKKSPPLMSIWYTICIFSSNSWIVYLMKILLHWIPALLMDLILIFSGKSPRMLKQYSNVNRKMYMLEIFAKKEWTFENKNTQELWSLLNPVDRNLFWFSFKGIDWKSYIEVYYHGMKKHLLHEHENDLENALTKNRKLFWLHYCCVALICLILTVVVICIR